MPQVLLTQTSLLSALDHELLFSDTTHNAQVQTVSCRLVIIAVFPLLTYRV